MALAVQQTVSLGSQLRGTALRQPAVSSKAGAKASFVVRAGGSTKAGGYAEELVKTAVRSLRLPSASGSTLAPRMNSPLSPWPQIYAWLS